MANSRIPIDLPAGVIKRAAEAAAGARYIDTQWMRFRDGKPEKIGGWQSLAAGLTGKVRGMLGWTTSAQNQKVAAGTYIKLYSVGDSPDNITPLRDSGTLGSDPFTTTNMSAVVSVADTGHGLEAGAYVRFDGATAVGGITIDGEYTVTAVTDSDNYTITHSSAATSSASGGGSSVDYEYEINPGNQETSFDPILLLLEGDQQSNGDLLLLEGDQQSNGDSLLLEGDVGQFGVLSEIRYWSLDTYGSFLLALPSGGTLYQWDEPSDDPQATAVSNAPSSARAMFVTPERFPVLLGTTTPMTMQWPDNDDITDWTPSSSSTANNRTLQNGSRLMAGAAVADLISLVWSDKALYLMQYTGSTFVYDTRLVGDNCGLVAPDAFCAVFGSGYWLSDAGFMMYRGGVTPIPNEEDIRDFVLDNLDRDYIGKTWCGYNPSHREVWWGYVANGNTEPDSYVAVSLDTFRWFTGTLSRTAASHFATPANVPIMADTSSTIHRHETGLNGAGSAIEAYVETGIVPIAGRDRDLDIMGFVPDFQRQAGQIDVMLSAFEEPMDGSAFDTEALEIAEGDVIVDARLSGRYVKMKVTSDQIGGDIRLGVPLLEAMPAGMRRS